MGQLFVIKCPYCSVDVGVSGTLLSPEEARVSCHACGARIGVVITTYKRGLPKARRDANARAKALRGKLVQLKKPIYGSHAKYNAATGQYDRPILALTESILRVHTTEGTVLYLDAPDTGQCVGSCPLSDVTPYDGPDTPPEVPSFLGEK